MIKPVFILLSLLISISCSGHSGKQAGDSVIDTAAIMKETYNTLINPDTGVFHLTSANYVETMPSVARECNYPNEPVYTMCKSITIPDY